MRLDWFPAEWREEFGAFAGSELEGGPGFSELRANRFLQHLEQSGRSQVGAPEAEAGLAGEIAGECGDLFGVEIDDESLADDQSAPGLTSETLKELAARRDVSEIQRHEFERAVGPVSGKNLALDGNDVGEVGFVGAIDGAPERGVGNVADGSGGTHSRTKLVDLAP